MYPFTPSCASELPGGLGVQEDSRYAGGALYRTSSTFVVASVMDTEQSASAS